MYPMSTKRRRAPRGADELGETLQPTSALVRADSAQHSDCRHTVVRNGERRNERTGSLDAPSRLRLRASLRLERPSARRRSGSLRRSDVADSSVRARKRPNATVRSERPSAPAVRDAAHANSRCRCARKAGCARRQAATNRRIRLLMAVVAVDAEEQDRRTCKAQVVHCVAVWHVKRRQCGNDAASTAGNVVEMDEIDGQLLAQATDESRPWLALRAD